MKPKHDDDLAGLRDVRERIARSLRDVGRPAGAVELVCVSKNFGAAAIAPILAAGERVFGENKVQEAAEKWPRLRELYPDLQLHLIGPLQSNKAELAVEIFDVIETVDRPKIALALAEAARKLKRNLKFFVQVNIGEEPQKSGVFPRDLADLLSFCRDQAGLDISGLMCIPPVGQLASPYFALLKKLAAEHGLKKLSMGMSGDFELAIQLDATHVRVGSAIFGARAAPIEI